MECMCAYTPTHTDTHTYINTYEQTDIKYSNHKKNNWINVNATILKATRGQTCITKSTLIKATA